MRDKLPSHDLPSEQALISAAIQDALQVVSNVRRRFHGKEVFYDLRHRAIWRAIETMTDNARPVDLVTLCAWLDEHGFLQDCGGREYVAELFTLGELPSAWHSYADVILDRWAERQLMARCSATIQKLEEKAATIDELVRDHAIDVAGLEETRKAATDDLPRVKRPIDWADEVIAAFTNGGEADEPGTELPLGLPWKVRPGELTLAIGEKGNGKTTMLGYMAMHLMALDWKAFVSFLEEPPPHTMKMLVTQLLGDKRMIASEAATRRISDALAWYQRRMTVYDFRGILGYRVLLHAMEHAADRFGTKLFIVDSLMRLGIADDDYPEQGRCVLALASFAAKHNAHVILVNHLNKSDGDSRRRQRGSQQIVDNSNNVIEIIRNEKKQIRISEIHQQFEVKAISEQQRNELLDAERIDWDAKIKLINQRYQGSQQNGSTRLYFNRWSLQFAKNPDEVRRPTDFYKKFTMEEARQKS